MTPSYEEIRKQALRELVSSAHTLKDAIQNERPMTFYPGRIYLEEAEGLLEYVIKNLVRAHNECVK